MLRKAACLLLMATCVAIVLSRPSKDEAVVSMTDDLPQQKDPDGKDPANEAEDAAAGDDYAPSGNDANYPEDDRMNATGDATYDTDARYNDTAEASTICTLKFCKKITRGELNKLKDTFGEENVYDWSEMKTLNGTEDNELVLGPHEELNLTQTVNLDMNIGPVAPVLSKAVLQAAVSPVASPSTAVPEKKVA